MESTVTGNENTIVHVPQHCTVGKMSQVPELTKPDWCLTVVCSVPNTCQRFQLVEQPMPHTV